MVAVLFVALAPASARAQRELNVDDYRPAHDESGFLAIQGTATPGHLRWNLALFTGYSFGILRVNPDFTSQQVVIRHRLSATALFQLGLGGRFALAFELPTTLYQDGRPFALDDGGRSLDGAALGDVRLHGRLRIVGEPTDPNEERKEGPGIALMASVTAPTATRAAFHGSRLPEVDLSILADFRVLNLGIGATLGARIRADRERVGGRRHGSEMLWGVALAIPLPWFPDLLSVLEFRGSTDFGGRVNSPTEVDLGLRLKLGQVHLSFIGGTAFPHRAIGAPSARAIFGIRYTPGVTDQDGDGVPDRRDECPLLPEDFDGFEDEDGCKDPDNDNDMIPDVDDLCPNVEAIEGRDDDEDGCTDGEPRQRG